MKERQRDLIEKAKMSSRLAASSSAVKPDAPRLDPLHSPQGPVTPLALEGDDYFLLEHGGSGSRGNSSKMQNDSMGPDLDSVAPQLLSSRGAGGVHGR